MQAFEVVGDGSGGKSLEDVFYEHKVEMMCWHSTGSSRVACFMLTQSRRNKK